MTSNRIEASEKPQLETVGFQFRMLQRRLENFLRSLPATKSFSRLKKIDLSFETDLETLTCESLDKIFEYY